MAENLKQSKHSVLMKLHNLVYHKPQLSDCHDNYSVITIMIASIIVNIIFIGWKLFNKNTHAQFRRERSPKIRIFLALYSRFTQNNGYICSQKGDKQIKSCYQYIFANQRVVN